MKRILLMILTVFMVLGLTACTPSTSPDPTPQPTPTPQPAPEPTPEPAPVDDEIEVSLADFLTAMAYDQGRWACPGQFASFYLDFFEKDGKAWVTATEDGESILDSTFEITSVKYNKKTEGYTVQLLDGKTTAELHVDASRISMGFIMAENPYDSWNTTEYIMEQVVLIARYVLMEDGLLDEYRPYVELYSDGTFIFRENLYEGMGFITGMFTAGMNGYDFYVGNNDDLQGFAGYDVTEFSMNADSNGALVLDTDLCYSRAGSLFDIEQ